MNMHYPPAASHLLSWPPLTPPPLASGHRSDGTDHGPGSSATPLQPLSECGVGGLPKLVLLSNKGAPTKWPAHRT